MKVALISDIHGNLSALETVMNDIDKRGVDEVICLGDMVGKGPCSKEVIDICRNKCSIILNGNWEANLYNSYNALKQGNISKAGSRTLWNINDIGDERMEYFRILPHSTELYLSGKLIRIFHAHPKNFNRYYSDSPIEQRLELFDFGDCCDNKKQADVAIYADIHSTYMQVIDGRQLLNIGSVGNPLDICQASYVILEGDESNQINAGFNIQFIRLVYDIDRAVEMAKEANVPDLDGYISELKYAKYFKSD